MHRACTTIYVLFFHPTITAAMATVASAPKDAMPVHFGKLLSSQSTVPPDVKFEVYKHLRDRNAGIVVYGAHRLVLALRSMYFGAMLSWPGNDNNNAVIKLSNFDARMFEAVREFIYTGEWVDAHNADISLLLDVRFAAHVSELQGLEILCVRCLQRLDTPGSIIWPHGHANHRHRIPTWSRVYTPLIRPDGSPSMMTS